VEAIASLLLASWHSSLKQAYILGLVMQHTTNNSKQKLFPILVISEVPDMLLLVGTNTYLKLQ
jgi:hypothetical protein